MRAPLLLCVVALFLTLWSALQAQMPAPGWCTQTATQAAQTFSHCSLHSTIQNDPLAYKSSWCAKTNLKASYPIPLRDPDFYNNCTNVNAHCLPQPKNAALNNIVCVQRQPPGANNTFGEFTIFPAPPARLNQNESEVMVAPPMPTAVDQDCFVAMHTKPVEIYSDFYKARMQLLFVATRTGFLILDMGTETIIAEQVLQTGQHFEYISVVSGHVNNNAHVVCGAGNIVMDFRLSYDTNTGVFSVTMLNQATLPGVGAQIEAIEAFPDKATAHAAVLYNVGGQRFVVTYTLVALQNPGLTMKFINMPATTKFVRLRTYQHVTYDRDIPPPTQPGCFPEKAKHTMIMMYTQEHVYIFGYDRTATGTVDVDLNPITARGQSLFYTTPDQNTEISAVGIWGECFGDYNAISQVLWLGVAQREGTNHFLRFSALTEFSYVDMSCVVGQPNWWQAPASWRRINTACTPTAVTTCAQAPFQFKRLDGTCVNRVSVPGRQLSGPAVDVQARQFMHTEAATTGINDLQFAFYKSVYVALAKDILIFSFQELVCAKEGQPIIDFFTRIALSQNIRSLSISGNGMHVFASINRPVWELSNRNRLIEICDTIRRDPTSVQFLGKFVDVCKSRSPAPFDIYDFIQYYSQCNDKFFCPSFGNKVVNTDVVITESSTVPAGRHTLRPMKQHTCEAGFFCAALTSARRAKCPIGYKCPTPGLSSPVMCLSSTSYDIGCLEEGLIVEQPCPSGHICFNAGEAVEVPQGFSVRNVDRRNWIQCAYGEYCPLATSNETLAGLFNSITCPPGFYCPLPSTAAPILCNTTVNGTSMYCAGGTYTDNICPMGFYCPTSTTKIPCDDGYVCPPGTTMQKPCPEGYYCPNNIAFLLCPEGYYCSEGTTNPVKCQYLVYCPPGTTRPLYAIGASILAIIVLIFVLLGFVCLRCCQRCLRKKKSKKRLKKENISRIKNTDAFSAAANIAAAADGGVIEMQPMLGGEHTSEANSFLPRKKYTMDFEFADLSFIRKKNEAVIFSGASGNIRHGRTTCVLCEKSEIAQTFLKVLAGRAFDGTVAGTVKVNGLPEKKMSKFKNIVGYVESDPVLFGEFKVKEMLRFSAHSKLPSKTTFSQVTRKVKNTLAVLDLNDYANEYVGYRKFGFNTSQRKLVNIALEVVAEPTSLFLETPTEGLDVVKSKKIISHLRDIAQSGVTVVASMTRPQYDVFTMFDDVVLLSEKGEVVYNGPAASCLQYFEEIGFGVPSHANPVDYFVEITVGNVSRPGDHTFSPDRLTHYWDMKKREVGKPWADKKFEDTLTGLNSLASIGQSVSNPALATDDLSANLISSGPKVADLETQFITQEANREKNRKIIGYFGQYFLYTFRTILENIYHVKGLLFNFVFVFLLAVAIGAFYFNLEFVGPMSQNLQDQCPPFIKDKCALPRKDNLASLFLLTSAALSIAACYTSMKTFGSYKPIYKREARTGMKKLSYFLGKLTANAPYELIFPLLFVSVWYILVAPRVNFFAYYGIFVLLYSTMAGFGYAISIAFQRVHAMFICIMFIIISSMLAGYYPTVSQLTSQGTVFLSWLSPIRFSLELLYVTEVRNYELDGVNVQSALTNYGFNYWMIAPCVVMLFVYGVLYRLVALFFLWLLDPFVRETILTLFRFYSKRGFKRLKAAREKRKKQKRALLTQNSSKLNLTENFSEIPDNRESMDLQSYGGDLQSEIASHEQEQQQYQPFLSGEFQPPSIPISEQQDNNTTFI